MTPTRTVPEEQDRARLPDSATPIKDAAPPVERPQPFDPDWRERIERAKREWEEGRKSREGKPVVFAARVCEGRQASVVVRGDSQP